MTESQSLFELANNSSFNPVDRNSLVSQDAATSLHFERTVKSNALSFPANELLNLTTDEVYKLSQRIINRFVNIASTYHLKVDPYAMDMLKNGENNTIVHELDHFRVVIELRPEVINGATVNLLPLVDGKLLKLGTTVMYTTPKVPFTILERARIVLAPHRPSNGDYYELNHSIQADDVEKYRNAIISLVRTKPESKGKEKLIRLLGVKKR